MSMSHYESFNHTGDHFWVADGGLMLDAVSEAVEVREIEATIFDDGCAGIAEGSVWDAWAGTYLGTADAKFAEFAEYIEHPAYDGVA